MRDAGVRHIVALRGDPAGGVGSAYQPHPDGYANAAALVAGIRRLGDFEISVAAYPEKHPESPSIAADIDMLKRKVDAGADRAITQFFFDNDLFEAYVERVRAAGIDIPIVPGIVPVHNFSQIARFAARCGASVPAWLGKRFEGLDDDPPTRQLVAAAVAAEQVLDLVDRGVTDFHFYTMNRADLVYRHLPPPRHAPGQGHRRRRRRLEKIVRMIHIVVILVYRRFGMKTWQVQEAKAASAKSSNAPIARAQTITKHGKPERSWSPLPSTRA